jgi:hypothetical protein
VAKSFPDEEEGGFHGSFSGKGEDLIFVDTVLITRNRDSQVGRLVILRYQSTINTPNIAGKLLYTPTCGGGTKPFSRSFCTGNLSVLDKLVY